MTGHQSIVWLRRLIEIVLRFRRPNMVSEGDFWLDLGIVCLGIVIVPIMFLRGDWIGFLGGLIWLWLIAANAVGVEKHIKEDRYGN